MGILPVLNPRVVARLTKYFRAQHHQPLGWQRGSAVAFSTSLSRFNSSSGDPAKAPSKNDDKLDKFMDPEVQRLLKELTGRDYEVVFRKRAVGEKIREPKYSFMTAEQLEEQLEETRQRAEELLQMPPVLRARKPINKVIRVDPQLEGYEKQPATLLFTDISLGVTDRERIIVCRDPDGTLRHASWEERDKVNKIYFPTPGRKVMIPKMFTQPEALSEVLARASKEDNSYAFILDRACLQFEPDDPLFISVVEKTYDTIDEHGHYDYLKSTRHFGPLVFYLSRLRRVDKLLGYLIENERIEEASQLVSVFQLLFPESKTAKLKPEPGPDQLRIYIDMDSLTRSKLQLSLNAYLEQQRAKEELASGLEKAHGF